MGSPLTQGVSLCFMWGIDKDEIIDGGYELYKVNKKGKELLDSKKGVIKNSQCKLIINGEMHDKFQIDVWVKDEENTFRFLKIKSIRLNQ